MSNLEIFVFIIVPVGILAICAGALVIQRRANQAIKDRIAAMECLRADSAHHSKNNSMIMTSQFSYISNASLPMDRLGNMRDAPEEEATKEVPAYRLPSWQEPANLSIH